MPRLLIALALAGLFAPNLRAQPDRKAGPATQARIQKKTYDFKDAGKEMEYALFVPSGTTRRRRRRSSSPCTGWAATRSRSCATPA